MSSLDEKIEKYRQDIIPIPEYLNSSYLRFVNQRVSGSHQTLIFIDDDNSGSSIKIGKYINSKWYFDTPLYSNLFWSLIKKKGRSKRFIKIIKSMTEAQGMNDQKIGLKIK